MWISHFTFPALLIKLLPFPSVKDTPTALLAFAGALPDFTFFLLSLLGYEQIQYKPGTYKGCFRYDAVYPWSHSLIGQLGLGMGLGVLSSLVGGLRWGSIMPVVAAVVSHFVLDLPVHRKDMFLSPYDQHPIKRFSYNLLDKPSFIFRADLVMALLSLFPHYLRDHDSTDATTKYLALAGFLSLIQADFTYGYSVRMLPESLRGNALVHASLFMGQILVASYVVGRIIDGSALGSMRLKMPLFGLRLSDTKGHADDKPVTGLKYGNRGTVKNRGNPGQYGHAAPDTNPDHHPDVPRSKSYDAPRPAGQHLYSEVVRRGSVTETPSQYATKVPTQPREPQSELEKSYDQENSGVRREDRGTGMHSGRVGVHPDINFGNPFRFPSSKPQRVQTPPLPPDPLEFSGEPHSIPLPATNPSTPTMNNNNRNDNNNTATMNSIDPSSYFPQGQRLPYDTESGPLKKLEPARQGRHLSITLNTLGLVGVENKLDTSSSKPESTAVSSEPLLAPLQYQGQIQSRGQGQELGQNQVRERRLSVHKPMSPTRLRGDLNEGLGGREFDLGRDRGRDKEVRVRLVQERGRN